MPYKNIEDRRAQRRRYYRANKEKCREWNQNTPSSKIPRSKEKRRSIALELRTEALKALGNQCLKCGFNDRRALQIDHVCGDSSRDCSEAGNRRVITKKRILGSPGVYQLLCANCHAIKTIENKDYLPDDPGTSSTTEDQLLLSPSLFF